MGSYYSPYAYFDLSAPVTIEPYDWCQVCSRWIPELLGTSSGVYPIEKKGPRMTKYTVEILQEDIDGGCRRDADNCPGALAFNRALATLGLYAQVGAYQISFATEPWDDDGLNAGDLVGDVVTPVMLRHFISQYDEHGADGVSPFSFEIDLPDMRHYKLTLSGKEADTLACILASVGGSPDKSPRGHVTRMRNKLAMVGASSYYDKTEHGLKNGSIAFEDYPDSADYPDW